MFNNPGRKLKIVAVAVTVLLMLAAVIAGVIILANDGRDSWMAWPIMLGGVPFAWLSGLMTYGFGELVENTAYMAYRLQDKEEQ